MIITILITIITPIFCQYELRPDVTFGEHNDRFDLTDLINQQNQEMQNGMVKPDYQSEEHMGSDDFRRSNKKGKNHRKKDQEKKLLKKTRKNDLRIKKKIMKERKEHANNLANEILFAMAPKRKFGVENFAYHDNMKDIAEDELDFNQQLKFYDDKVTKYNRRMANFVAKLHQNNGRRVLEPEKEILFHHGFPVDIKVKSFLQIPLE